MNWLLLWLVGSFVFLLGYLSGVLLSRAGGVAEEASERNASRPSLGAPAFRTAVLVDRRKV